MAAPDRKKWELPMGARSTVAVFLAATLASWPARAQPPSPSPSARPSTPAPSADPWAQGSQPGTPSAPPATPRYPPAYPSPYPPSMPNPYGYGLAPAMPNPYASGGVYVELRTTSRNVRIERVISPGNALAVCFAPCRRVLPRDSIYIISGDGVRSSSQFVLPDDRDRVTLDVQPGSTGLAVGGSVLAYGGGLTAAMGFFLLLASIAIPAPDDSSGRDSLPGKATGGILLGSGILAVVLGWYLLKNARTTVTSSDGTRVSSAPWPPKKRARFALTPRGIEF